MSEFWSFTILLLIELAVLESQVNAFTIQRIQGTNDSAADLIQSESALQTKGDITPNHVKVIDIKHDGIQKFFPIETTTKTEDIRKSVDSKDNVPTLSSSTTNFDYEEEDETVSNSVSTLSTAEDVNESGEDATESSKNTDVQQTTQATASTTRENESKSETSTITSTEINVSIETTTKDEEETDSATISSEKQETTTTITQSTEITNSDVEPASTQLTKRSTNPETTTPEVVNTTRSEIITTNEPIKETDKSTESLIGSQSSATTVPYWKKYTIIDRKRTSSTTEENTLTSTEKDELIPAGSAQSSISLEKAFSITSDIPSLENLKNDLLQQTSKLSTTESTKDVNTKSPIPFETSSSTSLEFNERTNRIGVVSSKRAGFLDMSSRSTAETTTEVISETTKDVISTTLNITTSTGISQPVTATLKDQFGEKISKKETGMASQSQLAEDAINEELMKEEMINDNVENAKRFKEERVDTIKTTTESMKAQERNSQDNSAEDKLSVKPINADKKAALYTVSPNYKPLKKIDVVPPKPFVRNPDDNSWRNESLSSLGIVFKGKNSSKPFTQVLKNKTETEWNTLLDKYNKDIEPELRERLVKISEIRKRKKMVDKFGETVYTDYEESNSSSESSGLLNGDFPDNVMLPVADNTPPNPLKTDILRETAKETTTSRVYINTETEISSTVKPKKIFTMESYDNDEDDADYVTLPNIDIKKFVTSKEGDTQKSLPEKPILQFLPERKPTVQYFPPRTTKKVQQINEYDDLQNKLNQFVVNTTPKKIPMNYLTIPTYPNQKLEISRHNTARPINQIMPRQKPLDLNKNIYLTNPSEVEQSGFEGYNKGSYVIKHLGDFLNVASKDTDDDGNPPTYVTAPPLRGVTTNELKSSKVKPPADYYDYEAQFRKDVLERFVENFNQNSDRFKVDFPILYNTSVVHSKLAENGKAHASSSAFVKRLYDSEKVKPGDYVKSYDPNCDRTVELSPAYELHYYVPEEEEKEEVEPKTITLPYRFRI